MDNNYYVYRHICPDGKVYVGVTTNPKRRWEAHGSNYFDHPIFCAAIKNFGWDNIKHIIAFSCADKDKARRKEKKLAEYYQYYGLSLNAGNGHSHSPSAQNRQKVAEARRKGTNDPFQKVTSVCLCSGGYILIKDVEFEQDPNTQDHWQDIREKAAIAVLPQCLKTVQDVLLRGGSITEATIARQAATNAVDYADALVKKLKESNQ